MTISSTQTKTIYNGNGATTAFSIPFIFFTSSELLVVETVLLTGVETVKTLNVDYTVTGGNGNIGTANALSAPPSTVSWTIKRNTDRTQLVDYIPNDAFPAEIHERALDKVTAITQEIEETIGRTVKISIGSPLSNIELPSPGAGQVIGWNATGDALTVFDLAATGLLTLPVGIAQGGTGGITKQAALQNLNLSCLRVYKYNNFI